MNTFKFSALTLAALGGAALIFGGWKYRAAEKARAQLAESSHRQSQVRAQLARLEAQQETNAQRADAVEADNAQLASAIEKARVAQRTKAQRDALPLPRATVEERLKQARALLDAGDSDAALRELLWCYDEGVPRVEGSGKRTLLTLVATALRQLAEGHSPTQAALRERLEKTRQRVLANSDDTDAIAEFSLLAGALREEQALVALYDRFPPEDGRRQKLAIQGFEQFVAQRRYHDALVGREYSMMNSLFEMNTQPRSLPPNARNPDQTRQRLRDYAIHSTLTNVEVLAGAGHTEQAQTLAGKLLKYDESPATRALLHKHLERAGRPELLPPPAQP